MSQGELLSLSVSIFLPRAALAESPFRFAVIDDPVQSMDPAKVDGLARVLARAAETRQIVVFTHDDRLPEAVRRLRLPAKVLRVDRRAKSAVAIRASKPPVMRYLDDARAVLKSNVDEAEVVRRVVPNLCRMSIEAACADLARRRGVQRGDDPEETAAALKDAHKLVDQLALAMFGDRQRSGEVYGELRRLSGAGAAVELVQAVNAGAHGRLAVAPGELPRRTEQVVRLLYEAA